MAENNVADTKKNGNILRASSHTDPKKLAGSITATIKEHGWAEVRAIGDGAIGCSVRASIIAKGYLSTAGIHLIIEPFFFQTEISGDERTGVTLRLEDR